MASISSTLKNLIDPATDPKDWVKWEDAERAAPSDEEGKISRLCEITEKMQKRNLDDQGKAFRTTHVKSLAFVKGSLTVHSDLPSHLRVGLFAEPGKKYDAVARYANEPIHIQPDTEKAPRGLGVKLFGVEGEAIDGKEGTGTMDLHFNNAPMLELTDLTTCVEIFELRDKFWDDPDGLAEALKKRSDSSKQLAPTSLPNTPVIAATMFTQSAFRFGPYVAHLSLLPTESSQTPLSSNLQITTSLTNPGPDAHRDALRRHFASHSATYTLRAQFSTSLETEPVEDASVVWATKWHDLATLEFPAQESWSTERRDWYEDRVRLSPWNALEVHRPLGSVNRLRRRVYEESKDRRAKMNGKSVDFPRSISDVPA